MHGAVSTMGYFEMAKTAIKTVMSRPATLMYPARPGKMTTLSRGHVVIDVSRCISCGMCMKKCPAEALCVDKEAKTWTIDRLRCVLKSARFIASPWRGIIHLPSSLTVGWKRSPSRMSSRNAQRRMNPESLPKREKWFRVFLRSSGSIYPLPVRGDSDIFLRGDRRSIPAPEGDAVVLSRAQSDRQNEE